MCSTLGYVYDKGQQKGMKCKLTGPFAMHVCDPIWPTLDDSGHIVLRVLVQEIPPQDSSLRFSHFQHTEFRIDLGPVTNIFMHWTCDHIGAWGFMITDITAHSTAFAQEATPSLSPVPRSMAPIHTKLHLSESPSQAWKDANWNMKHEYESASLDSDIIMGNKARRQICNLSHYPILSNVILSKPHLHSFWSIFYNTVYFFLYGIRMRIKITID